MKKIKDIIKAVETGCDNIITTHIYGAKYDWLLKYASKNGYNVELINSPDYPSGSYRLIRQEQIQEDTVKRQAFMPRVFGLPLPQFLICFAVSVLLCLVILGIRAFTS